MTENSTKPFVSQQEWEEKRSEGYSYNLFPGTDSHAILQNFVRPGSIVLDAGCSRGGIGVKLFREKQCKMYGMEYNSVSVQCAQETGAYQAVHTVNLESFSAADWSEYRSFFDFILLGDILEHLRNPQKVLEELKPLLKQDGAFLISVPNIAHAGIKANLLNDDFIYTDIGLLDVTHVHLFTWKSIAEMLSEISLEIVEAHGTVAERSWSQPFDPLDALPLQCRRLILKDIHSWIVQYVMKITVTEPISKEELLHKNQKALHFTKETLPKEIYMYNDRSHYYKAVYGPILKNILLKLRSFFSCRPRD